MTISFNIVTGITGNPKPGSSESSPKKIPAEPAAHCTDFSLETVQKLMKNLPPASLLNSSYNCVKLEINPP